MRWVLLIVLAGCVSGQVGVTRLKDVPSNSAGCPLVIYSDEKEIPGEFEVLCVLDAKTSGNEWKENSIAAAVEETRPQACACGADGILLMGGSQQGASLLSNSRGYATVKAIRLKK